MAVHGTNWWRLITVQRWRKALALNQSQVIFNQVYADIDGFSASREARGAHDALDYVYGEIDFISFVALLSLAKPDEKTVFYDLGSGTGKAVLACAMVFHVQESRGIELFEALHNIACSQHQALCSMPDYTQPNTVIRFVHGDFLHEHLGHATLVYINATGFFGETWQAISARLEQTPSCTMVISTSKALKSNVFRVIKTTKVQMSWGIVNAYIQQRIKNT